MKKKIATAIFTAITALAFADDSAHQLPISTDKKIATTERVDASHSSSCVYLRMGVTDGYPTDSVQILPGMGVGVRAPVGSGAFDFSANYMGGYYDKNEQKEKSYFYTLPKLAYLHYLSPLKSHSLYAGIGLAFGEMKNKEGTKFRGLFPSASIGYELGRLSTLRSFMQLDVSQPAVAPNMTTTE